MVRLSFLDHFSAPDDPRQPDKVVYPLPEIMLLILCGTLAGAEDFMEIRQWARQKLRFLRSILPFARGIPSHDTLNDGMNALPGGLFSETFAAWVEGLREAAPDSVAIDGKTSRRARGSEGHPLHVVSAWAARQRLVLGQEATQAKSNEISAIPLLLERLQLTGVLVTIDAMGTRDQDRRDHPGSRTEPRRLYRRAKLSENCRLWTRNRRAPRSRIPPSSAHARCGWLWNTAMTIRAKLRR